MSEKYDVPHALEAMNALKKEIVTDNVKNEEKQKLIDLISIMATMPNLLRENDTILKAIERNRDSLTQFEAEVIEAEKTKTNRIAELHALVFSEEQKTQQRLKENKEFEEEETSKSVDRISTMRASEESKQAAIKKDTQDIKDLYDIEKEKYDQLLADARLFKEKVNKFGDE